MDHDYSDWENVDQFEDYAEVSILFRKSYSHEFKSFNATAEHPVTDGCMWSYDPDYPEANFRKLESFLQKATGISEDGLFYNSTEEINGLGCAIEAGAFIANNVELINPQLFLQCPSLSLLFFCDHSFVLAPFKLITSQINFFSLQNVIQLRNT